MPKVNPPCPPIGNSLKILGCISRHGPLTKRDIQQRTGASWGAVSTITAKLIEQGEIFETPAISTGVGRRPGMLDISDCKNLAVGIDINILGITAVAINLKGQPLYKLCRPVAGTGVAEVLEQLITMLKDVFAHNEGRHFLGIGIAMQGSVDSSRGISRYAPFFHNWHNVPLQGVLEEAFGLPVIVRHDPECMAYAEMHRGKAKNTNNFALIRISSGIGMGLVLNGRLYSGHENAAGELGHVTIHKNGLPCGCGARGCLEMYASIRGLMYQASQINGFTEKMVDFDQIAAYAMNGREEFRQMFNCAGESLGIALRGIVHTLSPELIVLGGDMLRYSRLFLPKAEEIMREGKWFHSLPAVKLSSIPDGAALGAAMLHTQRYLSC